MIRVFYIERKFNIKYFKQTKEEEILLSQCQKSSIQAEIKYLIKRLGDVKMEESMIQAFCSSIFSYGGRYGFDVRNRTETIKAMYEISQKYPLTPEAIKTIWTEYYIKDLFDKYDLITCLGKLIKEFGYTDDTFEIYCKYIEVQAEKQQSIFDEEAKKLDEIGDVALPRLISKVKKEHYYFDDIVKYLPSKELREKDHNFLVELSRTTRIYMGSCLPVWISIMGELLETGSLDDVDDEIYYTIGDKKYLTFTKQEFLDSLKQTKELRKKW